MTKRIAIAVAAVLCLAFSMPERAAAQEGNHACNNRLIKGNYGFAIEGQKLGGPGPVGPQVGVAMANFDGVGNLSQIDTVTINGIPVADFTEKPASGKYMVNPDCTGMFNIVFTDKRPPVTVSFVVVNGGKEIDTVVTSAGGMSGIIATRSIGKRVATPDEQ